MNSLVSLLSGVFDKGWVIILVLLLVFGAIVAAVILVRRKSKYFKNDEKPKSEKEIAQEEVNRVLESVDDPTVSEAIQSFKEEAKKEEASDEEIGEDKPLL